MGFILILVYVVGSAVTARAVLSGHSSGQGAALSAGEIVLWPLYWAWFGITAYRGRDRRP